MEEATKETVIIVHGTFAAPKPGARQWHQPTLDTAQIEFIARLNDALRKRGSVARCWAHCSQGDQSFHWPGTNNWIDRTEAASELGNYVLKLRNEGWCCHIVAHSHGGNVVLEALPQITTALPSRVPLGKIITLGTPFMNTTPPILQKISRDRRSLVRVSWMNIILFTTLIISYAATAILAANLTSSRIAIMFIAVAIAATAVALVFVFFSRKDIAQPIAQMQPKFLAIGSPMDEPWQLLYHMRNASNPMAVQKSLINYLVSSIKARVSRSNQIARIYGDKSYRDLEPVSRWFVALIYLLFIPCLYGAWLTLKEEWRPLEPVESGRMSLSLLTIFVLFFALPLLTFIFGPGFLSAVMSPLRWCRHRLFAITGIFGDFLTFLVRRRAWSVAVAIAMGLEGYRHQLPLIEKSPPGVKYEDMPTDAEQRALAKRGDWIYRHLNDLSETFSKLVVTSADIKLLLSTIGADQTLVHAAYYTENECIARIADWIAAADAMPANAAVAAEVRGDV